MLVSEVIDRAKQRADMVSSNFITPGEYLDWFNEAGEELHGLMMTAYEDYFTDPSHTQFTLTTGSVYALPDDFQKLRGLDVAEGGCWVRMTPRKLEDRSAGELTWSRPGLSEPRGYALMGHSLKIYPETNPSGTYRFQYIHRWRQLGLNDSLPKQMEAWSNFLVVDIAISAFTKQESDPGDLPSRKARLIERITRESPNRDASEQEFVTDVDKAWWSPWH